MNITLSLNLVNCVLKFSLLVGPSVLKKTTKKIQPKAVSSKVKKTTPSGSLMKPQKKTC